MENITPELINTVGFPIAVCGVLFWFIKGILKDLTATVGELNKSVMLNTEILRVLSNKLER